MRLKQVVFLASCLNFSKTLSLVAPMKMKKWKWKDKLKNMTILYTISSKNVSMVVNGHNL